MMKKMHLISLPWKMRTNRVYQNNRGIALLMVLWVIVLLSVISLNFINTARWNSLSTHNLREETSSYYLALSGYQEAVRYILSDKDPAIDYLDNENNYWVDSEHQPVTGKSIRPEGEIEIRIVDEDARININFSSPARLRRLFEYAGVVEDEINTLIDSVLDWRDPDREHHLSGAEDSYYESLADAYTAKNSFFDVPDELSLIKGMNAEYMSGSETVQSLLPLITTFGTGRININTASREILALLGLNEMEIETVLKQRTRETGGFRFIPQQFALYGLNSIASSNFRIEVVAKAHGSTLASRVVAVVQRQASTKGFKLQTVYWRESVEHTRG